MIQRWGIACAAGGFRGAFSHGVLAAFERVGWRARAYSAVSSTVTPAAFAAAGGLERLKGPEYWLKGWRAYRETGSMSESHRLAMAVYGAWLERHLFSPQAADFMTGANRIVNAKAAQRAQGDGFLRLGRELLLRIRTNDASWAEKNLAIRWFCSKAMANCHRLTAENMAAVFYAASRYLHSGWDEPAWIDGEPYLDAVYTAALPVEPLIRAGVEAILVLHHEVGELYLDFFRSQRLPDQMMGIPIHCLGPSEALPDLGVDVMRATESSLLAAFEIGLKQAETFIRTAG